MKKICYYILNCNFGDMKNTLLLLIITNCISLSAQHLIQSELSVIENGSILINPFTGGD